MATEAQHDPRHERLPPPLHALGEEAGLTQRDRDDRLEKTQNCGYNGERANRRVDDTESVAWAQECGLDALVAMARVLKTS
jgi:hypothetical protein